MDTAQGFSLVRATMAGAVQATFKPAEDGGVQGGPSPESGGFVVRRNPDEQHRGNKDSFFLFLDFGEVCRILFGYIVSRMAFRVAASCSSQLRDSLTS